MTRRKSRWRSKLAPQEICHPGALMPTAAHGPGGPQIIGLNMRIGLHAHDLLLLHLQLSQGFSMKRKTGRVQQIAIDRRMGHAS